ncbi:MAG: hypothetical protein Q9169_001975 [Polycauliona sp. 2 TL-2023]
MTRPLKKKNGVVAGMPRSSGVRNSPIGSSHADGEGLVRQVVFPHVILILVQLSFPPFGTYKTPAWWASSSMRRLFDSLRLADDLDHGTCYRQAADMRLQNSDECSACGGPGELLCCDGCSRSFHFTCIDPPKHTLPDGEWYCRACAVQPSPPPVKGIFPILVHSFERKNPRAYTLHRSIREYFENVITGDDGEYEESVAPLSKAKTRNGYDQPVDTCKLTDGKEKIILCFCCGRSAMGRREMVNCDFCASYWHLDCLDPPLATAPKKFGKGTWKCPNHVDDYVVVPRSASGKTYTPRRPRHPRVIQSALVRGTKNNGFIEIEDEISEEEDQPSGTVYRITPQAIKLDFISKIKQSNQTAAMAGQHARGGFRGEERQRHQHAVGGEEESHQDAVFRGRTVAEREAAVNLAQFAHSDADSQMSGDRVGELVSALYAEAPVEINGLTNGNQHTLGMTNGNGPFGNANGNILAMEDAPSHSNAASSNKAAYAANHVRSTGNPPTADPQALLAEEEEILQLEAIVQRRKAAIQRQIANMHTVAASL